MNISAHPSLSRTWRGVAALCALMIGLLGLFAVSSQLHDSVHDDANHVDHTCTITLFSQGLEDSLGWADLVVSPALFPAGRIAAIPVALLTDTPYRLPPGRGPPLC